MSQEALAGYLQAFITLIVGFIAIIVYKRQRSDEKRSAANIIFLEIKTAETTLKQARELVNSSRRKGLTKIPPHHFVMPQENWSKYKHLFVNDFSDINLEKINKFYEDCQLFDETIRFNDSIFLGDTTEIRRNIHKAIYSIVIDRSEELLRATPAIRDEKLADIKNLIAVAGTAYTDPEYMFNYQPMKPIQDIEKSIDTISMDLTVSHIGQRLKEISAGKRWKLLIKKLLKLS